MKEKRASDRPLFLPLYSIADLVCSIADLVCSIADLVSGIADLIYNIVVFGRGAEEWHSLIISGRAGRNLPSQNTSGSEQMPFCSEIS